MKNKILQKLLSVLTILSILLANCSVVFAQELNSSKEEVVYGILNQDGSVNNAYIVNVFDQEGEIIDYGDYSQVRNMTSEEEITLTDGKVKFSKGKEKLYYEGKLNKQELPWDISFKYFIDGQEYSGNKIAGMSGDLEIRLAIKKNQKVDSFFYDNYGLQVILLLDSNKVKDIQANEATIANVGKNKQLTYTILPKKGANLTIKAKVKDFEMEAIAINGININLGLDVDNQKLLNQIEDLQKGVETINEGASDLNNGASQLKDGSNQLANGSESLELGAVKINDGLNSLKSGIEQMNNSLGELTNKSEDLREGSNQFKTLINNSSDQLTTLSKKVEEIDRMLQASKEIQGGIDQLNSSLIELNQNMGYDQFIAILEQNGLDLNQIQAGNNNGLNTLNALIESLTNVSAQIQASELENKEELVAQLDQTINTALTTGLDQIFVGNNAVFEVTAQYLNQLSDASAQIQVASQDLNDSYAQFQSAIEEMAINSDQLIAEIPNLEDGVEELIEKYNQFDEGISEYTQAVDQLAAGQEEVLNGARSLSQGVIDLELGSASLNENLHQFSHATKELFNGTEELKEGSDNFKDKTANLDKKVENEIDETISEMMGDASQPVSFASVKNGRIKSVQFVLKSPAIEIKEIEKEETLQEESQPSAWDKVKALFKGEEE